MNSKIGRFCFLTISFILGAFFLLVGCYGILISLSSFLQAQLIDLIIDQTLILSLFGLGLALIGLSILIYAIFQSKRRYYDIRAGQALVTVDESLIQQYLQNYWHEQFPRHSVPSRLKIKKKAIHILADLPSLPQEEQKAFLDRVQKDFAAIFGHLLGYPHEVYLTASFQSDRTKK